jgi:uncharacterized membrane protein YfcA
MWEFFALAVFAFCAGFIDSVAGGGGLIQLPGLMITLPGVPFPVLSGTNKIASICGTAYSVFRYHKTLILDRRVLMFAAPAAFAASLTGARLVSFLDPNLVKPIVVVALAIVGVYTILKPDFGAAEPRSLSEKSVAIGALLIGLIIGFYDGFIGPGTGSFLIFAFVLLLGLDFLHASATAKVVNVCTNAAAVSFFVSTGQFLPVHAAVMATANVAGAHLGTKLALEKGNVWIKKVFLISVTLLLGKLIYDLLPSTLQFVK